MASINEAFCENYSGTGVLPVEVKVKEKLNDNQIELRYKELMERKEREAVEQKEREELERKKNESIKIQLENLKEKVNTFKVLLTGHLSSTNEQEHFFNSLFSSNSNVKVCTVDNTELSKKLEDKFFLDFSNYKKIFDWKHNDVSTYPSGMKPIPDITSPYWDKYSRETVSEREERERKERMVVIKVNGSLYAQLSNERYVQIDYISSFDVETLRWNSDITVSYSEDVWGIVSLIERPEDQLAFIKKHETGWFY